MNYQNKSSNKRQSQTKKIYVTLAAAIVVISALTAVTNIRRNSDQPDATDSVVVTGNADTENEEVMAPITTVMTDATEKGTEVMAGTEVDTTVTTVQTAPPAVQIPDLISPVAGNVIKEHSGDVPVFSITMNDYRPHIGVDIEASVGTDVLAVADGIITKIWEDPMSGNCMSVEHDGGLVSVYRNISPLLPDKISAGSAVKSGQVIASVGETSLLEIAEVGHLHFELTLDGKTVDPAEYINFTFADTEYEG